MYRDSPSSTYLNFHSAPPFHVSEKVLEQLDGEALEQLCEDRGDLVLTTFEHVEKIPHLIGSWKSSSTFTLLDASIEQHADNVVHVLRVAIKLFASLGIRVWDVALTRSPHRFFLVIMDILRESAALFSKSDVLDGNDTTNAMVLEITQESLHLLLAFYHILPCSAVARDMNPDPQHCNASDPRLASTSMLMSMPFHDPRLASTSMLMSMPFNTVNYFLFELQESALPNRLKVDTLVTACTMFGRMYTANTILHCSPCCILRPPSESNLMFSKQDLYANLDVSFPPHDILKDQVTMDGSCFVYPWAQVDQSMTLTETYHGMLTAALESCASWPTRWLRMWGPLLIIDHVEQLLVAIAAHHGDFVDDIFDGGFEEDDFVDDKATKEDDADDEDEDDSDDDKALSMLYPRARGCSSSGNAADGEFEDDDFVDDEAMKDCDSDDEDADDPDDKDEHDSQPVLPLRSMLHTQVPWRQCTDCKKWRVVGNSGAKDSSCG